MNYSVLFDISYGMYILATKEGEELGGCIINTFMQITSENPIIAISLNKNNYTYEMIKKSRCFSLSILSEKTKPEIIGTFGFSSSKDTDKFANCEYELVNHLPVIKENCCGTLFFDLMSMTDMETHVVLFARLTNTIKTANEKPMTYSYYHSVIKGTAPKNAPTYQKDVVTEDSISYVCKVCSYVYKGDINEERDDYKCPICGKSKEYFEKR